MDLDKYMAEERSHTKETVDYWKSQLDRIRRQLDASEKSLRVALWASICGLVTSILMLVKFLLNVPIPTTAIIAMWAITLVVFLAALHIHESY